jgi:hypothetical protein
MSRPRTATRRSGGNAALRTRSHAKKSRASALRHIQVGKRAKAGPSAGAPGGRSRTHRSTCAASGQSASSATMLKPCRSTSLRVMAARAR